MTVGATSYPTAIDTSTELIQVVNSASNVIGTGGCDAVVTTIPVTDTTVAPSSGVAWCGTEAISYTGKTGTTLTGCVRGFDGTTAAAHALNDPIYFDIITSAHHEALRGAIIAIETALGARAAAAQSGAVRLDNAQWITARNAANTADVNLARITASDLIEFGVGLTTPGDVISSAGSLRSGGRTEFGEAGGRMIYSGGSVYFDHKGTGAMYFRSDNTDGSVARFQVSSANVAFNSSSADTDSIFFGLTDPDLFHVDASTDSVGVGVAVPLGWLHLKAGTTARAPLLFTIATNLTTTPLAGTHEYDGATHYLTAEATPGRPAVNAQTIYRLTGDSSALASASIADYFPASSSILLAASAIYEVTFHCYFTKTMAGTLVWTMLASSAPTAMSIGFGGSHAAGSAGTAAAATTVATVASASLTTAVKHYALIKAIVETNAACNVRLRVTPSAGTVTPLRGSFYTCRRLPAGNTGLFAA